MKIKRIITTVICAFLVLALFAGCAKPERIAVVNDLDGNQIDTIPFDMYHFWAYYNYAYYDSYYNYYQYYFNTTFKQTLDDIYDQTAENPITVNQFLTDSLVNDLKQQYVILKMFDNYGLPFGTREVTAVSSYYESMISNYGDTVVKKIRARLGMNVTEFKEMLKLLVKVSAVQDYLYGEEGPRKVTLEAAKQYFLDNYSRVKHIVIKSTYTVPDPEDETKTITKTYTEAEMQAIIDEIVEKYNAAPSLDTFLKLVGEYSVDTGTVKTKTVDDKTVPDYDYCSASYNSSTGALDVVEYGGYVFDRENNSFYHEFTDLANELDVNEIGTCKVTSQSADGSVTAMHVILKLDLKADDACTTAACAAADSDTVPYIIGIAESDDFTNLIEEEIAKYEFVFDEDLLAKYSMKNLKSIS